jgi:hypothetical protein
MVGEVPLPNCSQSARDSEAGTSVRIADLDHEDLTAVVLGLMRYLEAGTSVRIASRTRIPATPSLTTKHSRECILR